MLVELWNVLTISSVFLALLHAIIFGEDWIFKCLKKKKEYEFQPDYMNCKIFTNLERKKWCECRSGALWQDYT